MAQPTEFTIDDPQWIHQRLDHFLQQQLTDLSRTRIQSLIKSGDILLNQRTCKPNTPLREGDHIRVTLPAPVEVSIQAQEIPLNILFEDEHLIVINKPEGLVVHPAAGNPDGTLVNALLHHCTNLSGIGGELRPGIVHRLDKETSGCLIAAKHDLAHTRLTEAFSQRELEKIYLAAVNGVPSATSGLIENRLGRHPVDRKRMTTVTGATGKHAITRWQQLSIHRGCALIQCHLLTGRTHQLRVHLRETLQTAILGDPLYAQPQRQLLLMPRLMLHAWKLHLTHPITKVPLRFEAPAPPAFKPWLDAIPQP